MAFSDAPMEPRELSWMGASGSTMVMRSRAEVTPAGTGAAVDVASGSGVAVGAPPSPPEDCAGVPVAAGPPQTPGPAPVATGTWNNAIKPYNHPVRT